MACAERILTKVLQLPFYSGKKGVSFLSGESNPDSEEEPRSYEITRNKKPLGDFMAFPKQCEKHGMKSHTFREISCVSWFQLLFSGSKFEGTNCVDFCPLC